MGRFGEWAFISGGSEGVGAEFARRLAAGGTNLILAARRPEPLDVLAAGIRAEWPAIEVRTLPVDLCAPDALATIAAVSEGLPVETLICNAGAATAFGDFVDIDLEIHRRLTILNAISPMELAHLFGGGMKTRGRGAMIFIGSLSGLAGQPGLAAYSAGKAFLVGLAESLWIEMKPHGVDVLAFSIGRTATPSHLRTLPDRPADIQEPADVVDEALAALGKGPFAVPDKHRLTAHLLRTLPRDEATIFNGDRSRSTTRFMVK
jgi:short-subunit dehydrogenase